MDNLSEKTISKTFSSSLVFSVVHCCPEVAVVVSWGNENGNTKVAEGRENASWNDPPMAGLYRQPTSGKSDYSDAS